MLSAHDVETFLHDPTVNAREAAAPRARWLPSLDELVRHSEVLSVHVPLLPSTRAALDRRRPCSRTARAW